MQYLKWKDGNEYDGSQINPSWAFQEFGVKDSTIVSWVGPMNILGDNLIDYEDVGVDIKGNLMLNFIVEHFDEQPGNLKLAYHRQRMLVMITRDKLLDYGIRTTQDGDDIFIDNKKLSVSIATASISTMKMHFALNITTEGTPVDVETSALEDNNMSMEQIHELQDSIANTYMEYIETIDKDITKTRVF
ncbi:DUF366 family protein [Candidatus Methanosphaera massiliense]|jgi:hypothetical protein|uniref:DUF366 family protein n=1 Tax=Methanosphaera TaxID=2316 RepID=UPI0023800EB8|nr:DUF366 family protein [Candidatus Methanosphaera massiliense]MDE4077823.1 DUF366 family protein [Candidatus Methanosphaera massiliense]MDY2744230.1 DUF366 family protein [Methanosphaera sp.]